MVTVTDAHKIEVRHVEQRYSKRYNVDRYWCASHRLPVRDEFLLSHYHNIYTMLCKNEHA